MASRPIIKVLSKTRITLDGSDAQFITAAANSQLSNERVATSTSSVELDLSTSGQAKWQIPIAGVTEDKIANDAVTNDKLNVTLTKTVLLSVAGAAKLGGSGAGWVIDADNALPLATLPATQTSEVLLIPISGLWVGDTVTEVAVVGQVESAGNNVTLTLDVRKVTAAAADITDASLGTDGSGTLTSDTILSSANLAVTGLTEVLAADEMLYATITATTGNSTDIALMGLAVTFTRTLP